MRPHAAASVNRPIVTNQQPKVAPPLRLTAQLPLASATVSTPGGAAPDPERSSLAPTEPSGGDGPESGSDELKQAFMRLSPQGSLRWNFAGAFAQLEQRSGSNSSGPTTAAGLVLPQPPPRATKEVDGASSGKRDLLDKVINRYLVPRLQSWVDRRAAFVATESVLPEVERQMAEADHGLETTVEALRFLAARIQGLEDASLATDHPIDAMAFLIEPVDVTPVAESGVDALGARGATPPPKAGGIWSASAAPGSWFACWRMPAPTSPVLSPEGPVALAARQAGLRVHMGAITPHLAAVPSSSLAGLVLTGIVHRQALSA